MESHECVTPKTKTCNKCGATKEEILFRPKTSVCKECVSLYSNQHYLKNRKKVLERCKVRSVAKADQIREYSAAWYQRNRAQVLEKCNDYRKLPTVREREIARQRQYYAERSADIQEKRKTAMTDERKERVRQNSKDHYSRNPEYYTEKTARRRRTQFGATPAWADLKAIRRIYRIATETSKATGIKHHVDHIVPIKGKRVCGLHVEYNLQVIPALENHTKFNKF